MRRTLLLALAATFLIFGNALAADEFRCLDGLPVPSPHKSGEPWRACVNPKNALFHGSVWRWHENGQLESKEFYVNGNGEGEWSTWHDNGKPAALGSFRNGTKVGLWKYWDAAGHLETEVTYAQTGNKNLQYYPTGAKKAEGLTLRGQKIGMWTYWDDKGRQKARCDFAEGLFTLPDASCQLIADELAPKGYSKPIPKTTRSSSETALITIASEAYEFSVPEGWILDLDIARAEHVALAFYPKGGAWRGESPSLYVRPLFKQGEDFKTTAGKELAAFRDDVTQFQKLSDKGAKLKSIRPVLSATISYSPALHTDSPFIVSSGTILHETLAYVDASEHTVLLAALSCRNKKQLKEARSALKELLASLRIPQSAK